MGEETAEKPKYVGYGYHGGGRKKGSGTGRKYKTFSRRCAGISTVLSRNVRQLWGSTGRPLPGARFATFEICYATDGSG